MVIFWKFLSISLGHENFFYISVSFCGSHEDIEIEKSIQRMQFSEENQSIFLMIRSGHSFLFVHQITIFFVNWPKKKILKIDSYCRISFNDHRLRLSILYSRFVIDCFLFCINEIDLDQKKKKIHRQDNAKKVKDSSIFSGDSGFLHFLERIQKVLEDENFFFGSCYNQIRVEITWNEFLFRKNLFQ